MFGLPLAFGAPLVLLGLVALPLIWWLLRLTPPRPREEVFPPTAILERVAKPEETPAKSPWWLTLLRLLMAALVVLALAEPVWRPLAQQLTGSGPLRLVIDNGWTAGPDWEARRQTAERLIAEAQGATVTLVPTVGATADTMQPTDADTALERLRAMEPRPVPVDWTTLAERLVEPEAGTRTAWLSGGIAGAGIETFTEALGSPDLFVAPDVSEMAVLHSLTNTTDALRISVQRASAGVPLPVVVRAFDLKGRVLGEATTLLEERDATVALDLPAELRNDIARVAIADGEQAGAVQLLDDRFQRRRVGLVSGGNADNDQPLLAPLYYVTRALTPFADVREAASANSTEAIPQLIEEGASVLVLADIGTLPEEAAGALDRWVREGGVLVRFAGPRLAGSQDDKLVPVRLRRGDRQLGGSLTWEQPQALSAFADASPFAGLSVPDDVTVTRQVLAEPSIDLADATWASLADGTPLVTAASLGTGSVVLFHVTADTSWSNLALSGIFVDMLRRIVSLSSGANATLGGATEAVPLPPLRVLDAKGRLVPPPDGTEPLVLVRGETPAVDASHPPGLYGTNDAFSALNLFEGDPGLATIDPQVVGAAPTAYAQSEPLEAKPWLLGVAALLLLIDCLVVLWMAGAFARRRVAVASASLLLAFAAMQPLDAHAQDTSLPEEIASTLKTRLAFVRTGDSATDALALKGLRGLSQFLSSRTALEPGDPVGLDIENDEMSFYPLVYWPIEPAVPVPSAEAMARVEAFMRQGGTVLFDTRDQLEGGFGSVTAATSKLREILAVLDVPPLEPVPENHVMTRAFYLLDAFPGRFQGGQMWVAASATTEEPGSRPVLRGDGVSPIMITSNDMIGAWAVEPTGGFSLPTVPPDPLQRSHAFRVGVNVAMYTLTGNYKADQVHVPALLERLGQ